MPVLMAVSDVDGTLLWVEGDPGLRRAAERMRFLAGARWSEDVAGTALALGRPVRVRSAEHYATAVCGWSCSAAPVRDPAPGEVIGVLDLTGGDDLGRERALQFVRAAVGAVESELRVSALGGRVSGGAGAGGAPGWAAAPALRVLGPSHGTLVLDGTASPLSLRHSELLLILLAGAASGLTAASLAAALDDHRLAPVSVRAEAHRLRVVLADRTAGRLGLSPSPYRVCGRLDCDALTVRDALREGRAADAVDAWTGELLPASEAPAVRELREELHVGLRTAVLEGTDDGALLRWSRTDAGRDDPVVAAELVRRLPAGAPGRAVTGPPPELRAGPGRPGATPLQRGRSYGAGTNGTPRRCGVRGVRHRGGFHDGLPGPGDRGQRRHLRRPLRPLDRW